MTTDPTTLSDTSLRVEVAKTRAALEFAGAFRHDGAEPRIVPSYTDADTAARYQALTDEAVSRGVDA
jgi:hypothetical protein